MISNARLTYSNYYYEFSNAFSNVSTYENVLLPSVTYPGARKILFILDYMPQDDLESGRLLHGTTGKLLDSLESLAKDMFKKYDIPKFSWFACTFNAFQTYGKSKEFQHEARAEFTLRIEHLILKYRPDIVITFGDVILKYLIPKAVALSDGNPCAWHGVPIQHTVKHETKRDHSLTVVPNLSLNPVVIGGTAPCTLIGYMARRLAVGLLGHNPYAVNSEELSNYKAVYIDKVNKFDQLMDMLEQQPIVAVDTETRNLNKVTNTLLSIQFAKCTSYGYFVPIYHKDTPFTATELKYIIQRLKKYFEGANKNKYHVYTNALFDLNVLRKALSCKIMANSVFCIFSGEYSQDENYKSLETITGEYYYSLGNISVQYGFTGFLTAEFGKKNRGSIWNTPLTKPLIEYGVLDVVVPFAIHEKQLQYSEDIGHFKYKSLVIEQCSDLLHGFSKMSQSGSKIDVDYLFSLQSPASPIEKVIKNMELSLLSTEAAIKANALISYDKGIPEKSLFSGTGLVLAGSSTNQLNLRKIDHKHTLFFKVLKLKPLSKGASGKGKLDKAFQKEYADVPEVKMYTDLEKAKKLKNAFVKSFIKLLGSSDDLKSDNCIRPNFHYLKVVTGRTSASDPNLQQVPSHSELGKHIKRLFIAPIGFLYLKVDYRVHEVRGWGLISSDTALGGVFAKAKELRDAYRSHPTEELKQRLKYEADIHVMNAAYFFDLSFEQAAVKETRNSVKNVIFGLIYQMAISTLARNLKKDLSYTEELVGNFNKRFPKAMKWIETTKKTAKANLYYENPLGFRRHLWGYALPKELPQAGKIKGSMDRRAVNSPIQGMCAQFVAIGIRHLDRAIHKIWVEEERDVELKVCNSVHDSLENIASYENFLESLELVETSLTSGVRSEVVRRHNFKFVVDLEIDFELGATLADAQAWDTSLVELERIIFDSLVIQKYELKYDIDVIEAMDLVFVTGWKRAPKWLKKQAKNIGWEYNRNQYKKLLKEYCKINKYKEKGD